MTLDKRFLSFSLAFLILEVLGLLGSFFILWQSTLYFYGSGLIYEYIYGVFSTVYYFVFSYENLPLILIYWLYSRSAPLMLWIIIPIYIVLKLGLLFLKRFNLAHLSIFTPLLFAEVRFFTTGISGSQLWLFWILGIFLYTQQGLGLFVMMLVLFLGIYGVNFFENAFLFPLIKRVTKLLRENPELKLSELVKSSGFSLKQLYNTFSKIVYQGILLAVLTKNELVAFDKPKAQGFIVEAFRNTLEKTERINLDDLKHVMRISKIWFPPRKEETLNILRKAQDAGKLSAIIIENKIIRQREPSFAY